VNRESKNSDAGDVLVDRWCFDARRATDENHAGVKDLEWLMLCSQKHQLTY